MSEAVERDYTAGKICAVCGRKGRPENGWIHKTTDVQPVEISDNGVRWEAKDGVDAYCSVECVKSVDD